VQLDGDRWWLKDLGSASGTYLAGAAIREAPLEEPAEVEIGKGGPRLALAVEHVTLTQEAPARLAARPVGSETEVIRRYIEPESGAQPGKQTLMFRRAYQRALKRSSRRYRLAIAIALLALLGAGGVILHQARTARPPGASPAR
jgi:hypothetical protein